MAALQSPVKILRLWNKVNTMYGTAKADKKNKNKKRTGKEAVAYKQNEKINKGLTVLKTVSRGGLKSESKINKFEKRRFKTLRIMKRYCKLVKTLKLDVAANLPKFRKTVKQLTVIVSLLDPKLVPEIDEEGDIDFNAIADVDTAALDEALENEDLGNEDEEEDDDFDDELEEQEEVNETTTTEPTNETEEPSTTDTAAQLWSKRLMSITPRLKETLKSKPQNVELIKKAFATAQAQAQVKAFENALKLLDKLDTLLGTSNDTNGRDWGKVRGEVISAIRKLQTALIKSKQPGTAEIAKRLETVPKNLPVQINSPQEKSNVEQFLKSDETVSKAEMPNPWNISVSIRSPLLNVLQTMH